jgi:hypothetical protein
MKHTVSVRVEEALLRKAQTPLKTKSRSATVRKAKEAASAGGGDLPGDDLYVCLPVRLIHSGRIRN